MKQKISFYFLLVLISFCAGISGAIAFYGISLKPALTRMLTARALDVPAYRTLMPLANTPVSTPDFVKASEISRPCVVYIKVVSTENLGIDPFWDFFGNIGQVSSSGSGVIISPEGYIVTNSHVVHNAQKIEVVMNNNKRSFAAKVIGIDASSDLALIKIEGTNLPSITFGNSDNLQIGEWVLAVGNPFNLTSTVTAGIVSAKGRNINLVQNQFPIESFIQTDAAINPGNSGGALVSLEGKLVGINTAILSKTGSYAGYGFAIPVNIVKKVISDIREFGYVQRAFLEAEVTDIDETIAAKLVDDNLTGVYVNDVIEDGNAWNAGIRKGDLIIKVGDRYIDSRSEFDEQLAYHRPGDKVLMTVKHGKEIKEVSVILTNQRGSTTLEKSKSVHSDALGADLEEISKIEKEKYNIGGGVRIFNIGQGAIMRMNLPEGFIITQFNGRTYSSAEALKNDLEHASGSINIDGINPNGSRGRYSFYSY